MTIIKVRPSAEETDFFSNIDAHPILELWEWDDNRGRKISTASAD